MEKVLFNNKIEDAQINQFPWIDSTGLVTVAIANSSNQCEKII